MTKLSFRSTLLLSLVAVAALPANAAGKAVSSPDLFSFAEGGRIIEAPDYPEMNSMIAGPLNLIDDSTNTAWEGAAGEVSFTVELAELTELHGISFDTGPLDHDSKSPKEFVVEVSETSPTKGFTEVLSGTLKMGKIGQSFSFKPDERPTAQWVRLTLLNNYGDDNSSFNGFHGFGKQLTQDATMPDLSGKYFAANGVGPLNITDGDAGVTGCYAFAGGEFTGVVKGRVLTLDITHGIDNTRHTGVFQMMPGGKTLVGLVRNNEIGNFGTAEYYSAEKQSKKPTSC
jgi:Sad1 / UNC-like C-terminal